MVNIERLNIVKKKFLEKLYAFDNELLVQFDPQKYLNYIINYPKLYSYDYISKEVKEFCNNLQKNSNEKILELFHKLILILLILNSKEELERIQLPEDVKKLYMINFERIVKNIENNSFSHGFYLYPQDKFFKDLAVCSLRLIPAGAQKLDLVPFPKRFFLGNGLKQIIHKALFLFELKGLTPFYCMHTDSHDRDLLAEFNPDGSKRFYLRVAEILKINKDVKGVFGSSWMNDPHLTTISPKLSFTTEILINNGGKLFNMGTDAETIKDATYASLPRTKMFQEGKYYPTRYMAVWSRNKIISWADKQI